jgi:hypothetical protein
MDTLPGDSGELGRGGGDADGAEQARPPAHCSTGRLTTAQAGVVDAWRDRLREDRPLPGGDRAGEFARLAGSSDHPRASTSDAVAAAVAALLAWPPDPLDVAGYAYRAIRAQWEDSHGTPRPGAPVCPPVSYYLPPALADQAEALRDEARLAAVERLGQLPQEAARLYPGNTSRAEGARARYIDVQAERLGLHYTRQIPRGALARLAIDRWARRSPDEVAAAAVDWCQAVHVQWHRARRDMVKLRR